MAELTTDQGGKVMRRKALRAVSGVSALAAALLLGPTVAGAESKLEGEAAKAGRAVEEDSKKAAKDVGKGAKDAAEATEEDTESMFTKDGKPRADDPFALKPEGEASPSE
jgi:hypothetical protein